MTPPAAEPGTPPQSASKRRRVTACPVQSPATPGAVGGSLEGGIAAEGGPVVEKVLATKPTEPAGVEPSSKSMAAPMQGTGFVCVSVWGSVNLTVQLDCHQNCCGWEGEVAF